MTPLALFHECSADRAIVRTVRAADIREAAAKLGRVPHGHYVISAASHACGYVRALPSDRCPCCGVRQRKAGMPECERCASDRLALRRSGFAGPAAGPQRVRVPAAESRAVKGVATARRRQVAALYAELGNTAEVARQLGVTKQAVSLLLRQSGVEVLRRRGARLTPEERAERSRVSKAKHDRTRRAAKTDWQRESRRAHREGEA